MKNILYLLLFAVSAIACHDNKVGYLKTDGASFLPDSLIIRTTLDSVLDRARIANQAPWVSPQIQGVLGTPPLNYRITEVKASEGGNAVLFQQELTVRGIGVMQVPLVPASPQGRYTVSLEVYNEDYNHALPDVFTFIIQ